MTIMINDVTDPVIVSGSTMMIEGFTFTKEDAMPMRGVWHCNILDTDVTFTFANDNTYTYDGGAFGTYDGLFALSGDQLTMTMNGQTITVTIIGNTMDIEGYVFTKESAPQSVIGSWKCSDSDAFMRTVLDHAGMYDSTVTGEIRMVFHENHTYTMMLSITMDGTYRTNEMQGRYTYYDGELTIDGDTSTIVTGYTFMITDNVTGTGISMTFVKE